MNEVFLVFLSLSLSGSLIALLLLLLKPIIKPFKQNMAVLHFSDCDYTVFTSIWAGHKFNGDGIQSGQGLCRGRG